MLLKKLIKRSKNLQWYLLKERKEVDPESLHMKKQSQRKRRWLKVR